MSEDGEYVLTTTAKNLIVISTAVRAQKSHSGFLTSMGKNKPAPRKLVIKSEDIARHRMGEINFTPAHFNSGSSLERRIVTSTGLFIVTWNFRSVKLDRLDNYKVARYHDIVVADDFTYNDDGRIVVTLPNDVSVATRRNSASHISLFRATRSNCRLICDLVQICSGARVTSHTSYPTTFVPLASPFPFIRIAHCTGFFPYPFQISTVYDAFFPPCLQRCNLFHHSFCTRAN